MLSPTPAAESSPAQQVPDSGLLEDALRALDACHKIAQGSLKREAPDWTLETLCMQLRALGFGSVGMGVIDPEGKVRVVRGFRGHPHATADDSQVRLRQSDPQIISKVKQSGQEFITENNGHDRRGTTTEASSAGAPQPGSDNRRRSRDRRSPGRTAYLPIGTSDDVMGVVILDGDEYENELRQRRALVRPILAQAGLALRLSATNGKTGLKTRIIQKEHMASLGQLIVAVAHEINNPVGFVGSNLETLRDYLDSLRRLLSQYEELYEASAAGDPERSRRIRECIDELSHREDIGFALDDIDDLLRESFEGFDRIRRVVADLRSFSRTDVAQQDEVDVNEPLRETLRLVRPEFEPAVTVNLDLADLPKVSCNPSRLKQVFLNLLLNAAQAMNNKGEVNIQSRAEDGHVVVCIADTGPGIPKHLRPRVFEPFFTTKAQGTGMGLSICRDIMEQEGGALMLDPTTEAGTRFLVRLPIDRAAGSRAANAPPASTASLAAAG